MTASLSWFVPLATMLLVGCQQPDLRFEDDLDLDYDLVDIFVPEDGRSGGLHNPYLAGSEFAIWIWDDNDETDFYDWTVRSSDDSIIEVLDVHRKRHYRGRGRNDDEWVLVAHVRAGVAGSAELRVYDDRDDRGGAAEIIVATPNEIELRGAGPLFLERDDVSADLGAEPKLIGNGTATFQVDWYRDGERLAGNGEVTASSSSALILDAWGRETYFDETRDWLTLSTDAVEPDASETATIDISVNGNAIDSVDFDVVGDAWVDGLELRGRDESIAVEDTWLPILARALDENGDVIHGVAFDWDLDGADEPGEGDLFRYRFESGEWSLLGAEYAGMRVETMIQGNEGYVDSTNDAPTSCFCSADTDRPGRGIGFGLLALAGLGLIRRRDR